MGREPLTSLPKERLERLIRLSQGLLAVEDPRGALERALAAVQELVAARLSVGRHGILDGGFAVLATVRSRDSHEAPPSRKTMTAWCRACLDLLSDRDSIRQTRKQLERRRAWRDSSGGAPTPDNLLAVRLQDADGRASGVLVATDKRDGAFSAQDEALVAELASLASRALQHIQARIEAEEWARERAAIFAAMADAVIVFGRDGEPLLANPAARSLLGVAADADDPTAALRGVQLCSLRGRPVSEKRTPLARALRNNVVENERFLMMDSKGEQTIVIVSASPILSGERVVRVVEVIRDIGEIEQANQELRASEERFHSAIREAPCPIILHAEDGEILEVNKAWVKRSGYTRQDIPTVSDWLARAFGEAPKQVLRDLKRSYQTTTTIGLGEHSILSADGQRRLWDLCSSGLGAQRTGRRLAVTMAVDLTECREAEDSLHDLRRRLRTELSFSGIVGRDPKMLELFDTIRELAEVDAPVLVQGESGTGKELVANAIHNEGHRADKRFIAVNCGALPEALLESELFGHVRGAFTGAIRDKKGRFELANGGTVFLDEIGEVSTQIQVKLLRVLQEGTFERVGDEKTIQVDVRVISATNRNLEQEVAEGRFREDLYYRLCVIPVTLPPLRDRVGDIPLLANHILKRALREHGGRNVILSQDALALLMDYGWPGNVRELENALHYSLVKCKGDILRPHHFPPQIRSESLPLSPAKGPSDREDADGSSKPTSRKRPLTPEIVSQAIEDANGNKSQAARNLGVSRVTLYRHLKQSEGPDA